MFCPQCGNQLPDTAAFCGKCGAQIQSRNANANASGAAPKPAVSGQGVPDGVARAPRPSAPFAAGRPGSGAASGIASAFTPLGLAARAVAVIAAICMFMPWAGVPALSTFSDYASMIGIGSGGAVEYSIPGLGDAVGTLTRFVGSNSIQGLYTMVLVIWFVGFVLLAAGIVTSFIGKRSTGLLALGCLVVAVIGILWAIFTMLLNSSNNFEVFSIAGGCIGTILLGIVGCVLALASRSKA